MSCVTSIIYGWCVFVYLNLDSIDGVDGDSV